MAYEANLSAISLNAKVAIATPRVAVKFGAEGIEVAGAGDEVIGVLQNPVIAGEAGRVAIDGITMIAAGGAITKAAKVKVGANGVAVAAESGDTTFGIALEAATAANDVIAVLLK